MVEYSCKTKNFLKSVRPGFPSFHYMTMAIAENIAKQIMDALRAKDTVRLNTLRGIKAACVNELVAKRRKPEETLSDEETRVIIKRLVNQRKDSMEQFKKGNRDDLAKAEEAELKILESFLPAMISEEEIRKIAEKKKGELCVSDRAKIGALIGAVMAQVKGRADGSAVKKIVESLFSQVHPSP